MWALLGHIVKGEGDAAKQSRIHAFHIIYTRARANLTRAQARVCPDLATPLMITYIFLDQYVSHTSQPALT